MVQQAFGKNKILFIFLVAIMLMGCGHGKKVEKIESDIVAQVINYSEAENTVIVNIAVNPDADLNGTKGVYRRTRDEIAYAVGKNVTNRDLIVKGANIRAHLVNDVIESLEPLGEEIYDPKPENNNILMELPDDTQLVIDKFRVTPKLNGSTLFIDYTVKKREMGFTEIYKYDMKVELPGTFYELYKTDIDPEYSGMEVFAVGAENDNYFFTLINRPMK